MGKNTVRVVVRTRPTDHFASDTIAIADDSKTINVHTASRSAASGASSAAAATLETHAYKMDLVMKDASQETVFETCASDIVKNVLQGINGSILCYGQTGAGKTYTMMGGTDYRTRGLIPRIVKSMFDEATTQADRQFEIRVSFVEVYNDRLYDLLNPDSEEDFAILEDQRGSVTIRGVEARLCSQEAEALSLLFTGNTNRSVAEHALNVASSRSHTIFTLHVTTRSRVESESASLVGKLHCVDLAGSERLSKTHSEGIIVREAQAINKSLAFLEQVVMALGNSNRGHVPFRQSKLTAILKDSLGGNSRTTMIANVWPEARHLEETVSTLKFATRMMRVQADPTVNVMLDPATQIKQLQRQIADLKAELQMQNQLHGKSHIAYDGDIGEDERFEMEKTVKTYLASKAPPDIAVRSLREVKEYFRIFKACVEQRDAEVRMHGGSLPASIEPDTKQKAAVPTAGGGGAQQQRRNSTDGIGAVDGSQGFSVGVAAPAKSVKELSKGANPSSPGRSSYAGETPRGGVNTSGLQANHSTDDVGGPTSPSQFSANGTTANAPDRNVAFADFKRKEGARLATDLQQQQDQLSSKRKAAAELSVAVNQTKIALDGISQQLEARRQDRIARGDEDVVDEEEFELVRQMKQKKADYRRLYDELSVTKTSRDHLVRLVDHAKQQLLSQFDAWYDRTFVGEGQGSGAAAKLKAVVRGATAMADDDQLDEGEKFELLELQRVMDEDPDSVEYYRAKKMTLAKKATARKPAAPPGPGRRR